MFRQDVSLFLFFILSLSLLRIEFFRTFFILPLSLTLSLSHTHRRLLHEAEYDVGNKVKIAFYLFNDVLIHLPVEKAKKKMNLLFEQYHWPTGLIWIEVGCHDADLRAFSQILSLSFLYSMSFSLLLPSLSLFLFRSHKSL